MFANKEQTHSALWDKQGCVDHEGVNGIAKVVESKACVLKILALM